MITAGELRLSLGEGAMLPEKLSLFASANEHAFLRAEGILSGSSGGVEELPGGPAELFSSENGEKLFSGILWGIRIFERAGSRSASVLILSLSRELDCLPQNRFFQEGELPLSELLRELLPEEELPPRVPAGDIRGILLQYRETDWELLKRVFSRRDALLLPEYGGGKARFHIFSAGEEGKARELSFLPGSSELSRSASSLSFSEGLRFPERPASAGAFEEAVLRGGFGDGFSKACAVSGRGLSSLAEAGFFGLGPFFSPEEDVFSRTFFPPREDAFSRTLFFPGGDIDPEGCFFPDLGGAAWEERGDFPGQTPAFLFLSSRESARLGERLFFRGGRFFIGEVRAELSGGSLIFRYGLYPERMRIRERFNEGIAGLSLCGKVLRAEEESLALSFPEDTGRGGEKLYPWMPISGNVMYCMPEIGAGVRLFFGDRDERKKCFALDCCHAEGADGAGEIGLRTQNGQHFLLKGGGTELLSEDRLLLADSGLFGRSGQGIHLSAGRRALVYGKEIRIRSERDVDFQKL
ncbi:hypothetical protein [Oribacterium sp. oral taxon 078]|uniref:hypothetical protein n=1 Tax=Oribacterium sp. oral taxon 078 TaxID=652706 RepID=UPI0012DD0F35|nr:hypothetical protein [Oribacterium sp. oral taxon 078]